MYLVDVSLLILRTCDHIQDDNPQAPQIAPRPFHVITFFTILQHLLELSKLRTEYKLLKEKTG